MVDRKQAESETRVMTLDEAIKLAENGDADSMIALGDYYVGTGDTGDLSDALNWYKKACEIAPDPIQYESHPRIAHAYAQSCSLMGMFLAAEKQVTGDLKACVDSIVEYYKYATKLGYINKYRPALTIGMEERIYNNYVNASYWYAMYTFIIGDYVTTKKLLIDTGSEDEKIKLLFAQCIFGETDIAVDPQGIFDFYNIVSPFESNEIYADKPKDRYEEIVYMANLQGLAEVVRLGIGYQGMAPSDEHAYEILWFASSHMQLQSTKDIIDESLSHYKKSLFGSVKYKG